MPRLFAATCRMDVDQSDSEERHNEAMLDLEIAKFMEHAMGGQWASSGPNWTNTV